MRVTAYTRTVFQESGAAPLNSFFHIHKVFCNKVQVSLRGHYVSSLSYSVSCVCSTLVLLHLKLDGRPVHLFHFLRCQTKEKGCEDRGSLLARMIRMAMFLFSNERLVSLCGNLLIISIFLLYARTFLPRRNTSAFVTEFVSPPDLECYFCIDSRSEHRFFS